MSDAERYSWLTGLGGLRSCEIADAATNAHQSGRSRRLSWKKDEIVHDSPSEIGIDAPAWTPAPAQEFLDERYDVNYSFSSC